MEALFGGAVYVRRRGVCAINTDLEIHMGCRICTYIALLLIVFTFSGCYNKPVRHLASDASLLKVGESSREDVLIFLGDPDERQEVAEGVEKWLYRDKEMTLFEKTPLLGKQFGSPDYQRLVVTLVNGIVSKCRYYSNDKDDLNWADDYPWQKKKK